jgi:hypothetical protein
MFGVAELLTFTLMLTDPIVKVKVPEIKGEWATVWLVANFILEFEALTVNF